MDDMDNSEGGINPREAMLWAGIAAGAAAVAADHRDEGARALADEWAAIASALYDDDDNVTHIAHNMSYQLAVIARNTGAIGLSHSPGGLRTAGSWGRFPPARPLTRLEDAARGAPRNTTTTIRLRANPPPQHSVSAPAEGGGEGDEGG